MISQSHLWQPVGDRPEEGMLLVGLHGRGDSVEGFDWLQRGLAIPGLSALLLNAPDEYYTGYSWYDMPPDQLPGITRSRALLERTFGEIFARGFKPERTVLFGFSQGCLMTLEFGGRFKTPLAGYCGVSGYCYDPSRLIAEATPEAKARPWLVTHGTQDDVLDVERTRSQMAELQRGGFNLEYKEYPKPHTVDLRVELRDIRAWMARVLGVPTQAR